MHSNKVTTINADDMTIVPPFVCFVRDGSPSLFLQMDMIDSIERIEKGEWRGELFDIIARGD